MPTFVYINFPEKLIEEYLDYMAPHDPTIQQSLRIRSRKFHHNSSFISEREKDRHIYYDWHQRFSDTRHRVVGIVNPAHSASSQESPSIAPVAREISTPESLATFKMLFKHIERALQIGFRLGTLGTLHQASLDFLDRNPFGIVLLDSGTRDPRQPPGARTGQDPRRLTLSSDSIALVHTGDNARLQRLIGDALMAQHRSEVNPGGAMSALRRSGKRPFSIIVSPLSPSSFPLTTLRPAACVVIVDPERQDALSPDRLRALYGLTSGRSPLANLLAAGDECTERGSRAQDQLRHRAYPIGGDLPQDGNRTTRRVGAAAADNGHLSRVQSGETHNG